MYRQKESPSSELLMVFTKVANFFVPAVLVKIKK